VLSKYRAHFTSKTVCLNYFSLNSKCNVQSHCWPCTRCTIFSHTSSPRRNDAKDSRQCFRNFYRKSRESIPKYIERINAPCFCIDARNVNRNTLLTQLQYHTFNSFCNSSMVPSLSLVSIVCRHFYRWVYRRNSGDKLRSVWLSVVQIHRMTQLFQELSPAPVKHCS
jgi:hypothetical protein